MNRYTVAVSTAQPDGTHRWTTILVSQSWWAAFRAMTSARKRFEAVRLTWQGPES